jgi:hypothetical protein
MRDNNSLCAFLIEVVSLCPRPLVSVTLPIITYIAIAIPSRTLDMGDSIISICMTLASRAFSSFSPLTYLDKIVYRLIL